MNRWQPIEAAPKDGTWIMVYRGHGDWKLNFALVYWGYPYPGAKFTCWNDGNYHTDNYDPTYWMPLSEPLREGQ